MTPTITVEFDLDAADAGAYVLMASGCGMGPMPAGPRLFRGEPHPAIKFEHPTRPDAERDAATLRAYLAALPAGKREREAAARQQTGLKQP